MPSHFLGWLTGRDLRHSKFSYFFNVSCTSHPPYPTIPPLLPQEFIFSPFCGPFCLSSFYSVPLCLRTPSNSRVVIFWFFSDLHFVPPRTAPVLSSKTPPLFSAVHSHSPAHAHSRPPFDLPLVQNIRFSSGCLAIRSLPPWWSGGLFPPFLVVLFFFFSNPSFPEMVRLASNLLGPYT